MPSCNESSNCRACACDCACNCACDSKYIHEAEFSRRAADELARRLKEIIDMIDSEIKRDSEFMDEHKRHLLSNMRGIAENGGYTDDDLFDEK